MNATEERQQNAAVDRLPTCQMYIVQVRQKNKKRRVQCNQKKKNPEEGSSIEASNKP